MNISLKPSINPLPLQSPPLSETNVTSTQTQNQPTVRIDGNPELMSLINKDLEAQGLNAGAIAGQPTLSGPNQAISQIDAKGIAETLQHVSNIPEPVSKRIALSQDAFQLANEIVDNQVKTSNDKPITTHALLTHVTAAAIEDSNFHEEISQIASKAKKENQPLDPMSFYGPTIALLMLIISALQKIRESYAKQAAIATQINLSTAQAEASSIRAQGRHAMIQGITQAVVSGVIGIGAGVASMGLSIKEHRKTLSLNQTTSELESAKKQISKNEQRLVDLDHKLQTDSHHIQTSNKTATEKQQDLSSLNTIYQDNRTALKQGIKEAQDKQPDLTEKAAKLENQVRKLKYGSDISTVLQHSAQMGGGVAASTFEIEKAKERANETTTHAAREAVSGIQNTVGEGYKGINDLAEAIIQSIMSTNESTTRSLSSIGQAIKG